MKIFYKISFVVQVCALVLFLGCGTSTNTAGGSEDSETTFDMPETETAFYSPAVDTTPVFIATTSAQSISKVNALTKSAGWESGNPVYEIFNALREYQYPRDEGVIDVSNIYKLLFEAGNNYENALVEAVELPTPAVIEAPFDFGSEPRVYTHSSNHHALAAEGGTVFALLTWIWDESPKMSYGVIEGNFDQVTGDLMLDMVYLVDYESGGDYCLRTQIGGNETTHEFTLKAVKVGTVEGSYAISIVGAGVSQGDSPEDYFLLKVLDNNQLSAFPEGRWFRVPASATEDDLMELSAEGNDLEEISDPDNYASTIEARAPFALDGSDQATSVGDFSNSDLILE